MSSHTQTLTQTPHITRSICLLNTVNQPEVQEFKALCHFRQKDPGFKIQLLHGSGYNPKQMALKNKPKYISPQLRGVKMDFKCFSFELRLTSTPDVTSLRKHLF